MAHIAEFCTVNILALVKPYGDYSTASEVSPKK